MKKTSKAKWNDIFKNKETFGDDMVISLKDSEGKETTYTLGDLREYNEEHEGSLLESLEERETALKTEKQNLERGQESLSQIVMALAADTGEDVNTLVARLKTGKKATKKEVSKATGMSEDDPLFGDVFKQVNEFRGETDTKIQSLVKIIDNIRAATVNVTNTYLDDFYESRFERAMANVPEKAKKELKAQLTVESVRKMAEKSGYKDDKGRLVLSKAIDDLVSPYRAAEQEEQLRTKIRKELEDEQRMASIPKPGQGGPQRKATIDVSKSMDPLGDAMAAAANDDEMWNSLVPAGAA